MSRKILGLDIRSGHVSAVLLSSSIKGNVIESYYHIPLESDSEETDTDEALATALKTITDEIDISDVECIASFSADQVSYRNIRVPFKEPKKIKQVLPFELEPTMPLPIEHAVIDFQQLSLPKQQENTGILAAVIEKARLNQFLANLASVKINPQVVTIGGYSTALNIAKQNDIPNQAVVVDVDQKRATLFAISSGQVLIIRSVVLNASAAKPAESICRGILQTITAAEDILGIEYSPEAVFLTGKGVTSLDFKQEVADILDLTVKQIDLIQDIDISLEEESDNPWISESMDNALALAIFEVFENHGLNFNRRQFAAKKHWIAYRKDIMSSGILAGFIILLMLSNVFYDFYSMSQEMAGIDFQISKIFKSAFPETTIADTFVQQKQMKVKVNELKQQSVISGKAGQNLRSIDILNDISRSLPDEIDIELNRLVIGPESVTISGDTATFNSVDDMKNRLETGTTFNKVTISSANSDKTGKRINFKLKMQF